MREYECTIGMYLYTYIPNDVHYNNIVIYETCDG